MAYRLEPIVVEAELRSGSLITARFANEQNRDVFAVPGSPLDPRCRGSNDLMRQGAIICESASDVIDVLEPHVDGTSVITIWLFGTAHFKPPNDLKAAPQIGRSKKTKSNLRSKPSKGSSHSSPMNLDALIQQTRLHPSIALAALSELEIAGFIIHSDAGGYVLA